MRKHSLALLVVIGTLGLFSCDIPTTISWSEKTPTPKPTPSTPSSSETSFPQPSIITSVPTHDDDPVTDVVLPEQFTIDVNSDIALNDRSGTYAVNEDFDVSLENIQRDSDGAILLGNGGLISNEVGYSSWTSVTVEFEMKSEIGFLMAKSSYFPIDSPALGAEILESGVTYTFSAHEPRFFTLYAPVGEFKINSITLTTEWIEEPEVQEISSLTIMTINDLHGAAEEKSDVYQTGIAKLGAAYRNEAKAHPDETIILSIGDMFQGSALSNETRGGMILDWMNYIGFDAMAVGNHEFDWGISALEINAGRAHFPFLGVNIRKPNGVRPDWALPSRVIRRGQYKIGLVGAIGGQEEAQIDAGQLAGYFFNDNVADWVNQEAERLKRDEECNLVISMIHDADVGGLVNVDLALEGHTHQSYVTYERGLPHVQTYANGGNIREISFKDYGNGLELYDATQNLDYSSYLRYRTPEANSQAIYDHYYGKYESTINRVVGYTDHEMSRSEIAQLGVDSLVEYYARDGLYPELAGAVVNGGCARQTIPAGEITYGEIYAALPFDNDHLFCQVSGATLNAYQRDSYVVCAFAGESGVVHSRSFNVNTTFIVCVISYVAEKESYKRNLTEIARDSSVRIRDTVAWHFENQ